MTIKYEMVQATMQCTDIGSYETFGVKVYSVNGNEQILLEEIDDVFLDKQAATEFVDICNKLALSPIHIRDVIQDVL